MIGYLFWNPSREAFFLPYVDFPIYWYSLWFALGFYGAVVIGRSLVRSRANALVGEQETDLRAIGTYIERLALYCFFGLLIGARLGHVLFYDAAHYLEHPLQILALREGGLSSHGAVVGLFIALWFFHRKPTPYDYLPRGADLLDLLAISSAWTAGCIRVGNFFNQEIVGTQTSVPWAIVFGSPVDASGGVPRHPTQLYEAAVSFLLLACLLYLCRQGKFAKNGLIAGWVLIITFTARFFLEFLKAPQCAFDTGCLHMGQLLSLPVVVVGILLVIRAYRRR
jgi:phosphatidylglycerol---prolipoprotein diacylglyceryl transferase